MLYKNYQKIKIYSLKYKIKLKIPHKEVVIQKISIICKNLKNSKDRIIKKIVKIQ
jgi:hypothetical protein